jgi:Fe(II)/alpha-ketoglutarate-dependent arginine beta-hydroxylase
MLHFQLLETEIKQIEELLSEIASSAQAIDTRDFLARVPVWAHELPRRLRECLNQFRLEESYDGAVVISGLPVDDRLIGPTPASLDALPPALRTKREEAYLVVVASLLGDLIAWATQQAGRTIHDVFPVEQHRDMQIGTGSRELLTWHTEDAFHPLRGDYLAMFCLRNPQSVPTMIASIADVELDAETKRQLFQPRFTILPDESHRGTTGVADFAPESAAGIEEMLRAPQEIAVLFGDSARPYVRLDPFFMPPPEDAQAREALRRLIFELDNHIK